jgi:NAD(P)-dependent dehydrogenase (short-subunit alcohol dehydrogenase family)
MARKLPPVRHHGVMDLGLHGKVALVTGGSDGLGAATAARLVEEGASVAICARGEERLERTAARLREVGGDVLAVPTDVTRGADVDRFVAAALERWGRIDALVNNAGVHAGAPFESVTDEQWEADLGLKLQAAIRATRAALPALRAQGGAVVNVLAMAAKAPGAGSMPSSVSRAAGMAFTKALSKEVAADDVRVNAVLVGIIESDQWARRAADRGVPVEQVHQELATGLGIPLGRVGRAAEFADLVAYLVSERSSYVTGTAINVDGGLSPAV